MAWNDIDMWRKGHMAVAELVDAWRVVPRLIAAGYGYMCWKVVVWYMKLEPHMIEGCDPTILAERCLATVPSTQHAALVTAVVGIAAAVFGLYANSGKKWNGFTYWNKKTNEDQASPVPSATDSQSASRKAAPKISDL
jgi:hypothetical protein